MLSFKFGRYNKSVAGAVNGANQLLLDTGIEQLPTKPRNVDVDGALINDDFLSPNGIEQVLPAKNASGLQGKSHQQTEFFRPKLQIMIYYDGTTTFGLNVEGTAIEYRLGAGRRNCSPPDCSSNAGKQLAKRERFDNIVVCAKFKTVDFVLFFSTRGKHEDGHIGRRAKMPKHLKPIHPR